MIKKHLNINVKDIIKNIWLKNYYINWFNSMFNTTRNILYKFNYFPYIIQIISQFYNITEIY